MGVADGGCRWGLQMGAADGGCIWRAADGGCIWGAADGGCIWAAADGAAYGGLQMGTADGGCIWGLHMGATLIDCRWWLQIAMKSYYAVRMLYTSKRGVTESGKIN